jgi:hypothetical protein
MWCRICRQDVPVVAGARGNAMACPRCGGRLGNACLGGRATQLGAVADGGIDLTGQQFVEVTGTTPPVDWDNWELSDRMQPVKRMASRSSVVRQRTPWDPEHVVRIDTSHSGRRHAENCSTVADDAIKPAAGSESRGPLAWLSLGLGLACSTCGALLAVTGLVESRNDLWNVGLPLVVVGQLVLLLGLALRLRQVKRVARPGGP